MNTVGLEDAHDGVGAGPRDRPGGHHTPPPGRTRGDAPTRLDEARGDGRSG